MTQQGIGRRYVDSARSFIELARSLDDDEWATPVPCTPPWTVRDVLSHVSGVPDDALAGRTDGIATEPWTASQVRRNADRSVDQLLDRWESQAERFAAALDVMGERRPPWDCHCHEHDVRHALGRPGNRRSALVNDAAPALLSTLSEVPVSVTVEFDDGSTVAAGRPGCDARASLTTTRFEVFRSMLGRRRIDQVRALPWEGPDEHIDRVIDAWFIFGPSELAIIE